MQLPGKSAEFNGIGLPPITTSMQDSNSRAVTMAHTYLWKPQNCFANESKDMYMVSFQHAQGHLPLCCCLPIAG